MTGCGLSSHTLTTPSCHWGTRSAPTPLHYRTSCLCHRPKPPVTLNMGVVEAIDPAPSPCPSPVPGGYRLPRSSSYSPLQGRAGAELDLGAAAGGVLEGGGTAAERRTPLVDLFCETCSRPWLIGWWDQVGLGELAEGKKAWQWPSWIDAVDSSSVTATSMHAITTHLFAHSMLLCVFF